MLYLFLLNIQTLVLFSFSVSIRQERCIVGSLDSWKVSI
ncbi:hypothetical protein GLYMA_03G050951v4 [Glycine max]|nr:hypothetical protein GLYMA_03G050951v4 [Glycine max]